MNFGNFPNDTPRVDPNPPLGSPPKRNNEPKKQWEAFEIYQVSFGKDSALVYPEIYCPGTTAGWANQAPGYPFPIIRFEGVLSNERGGGSICQPPPDYTAKQSWEALFNALMYNIYLKRSVSTIN